MIATIGGVLGSCVAILGMGRWFLRAYMVQSKKIQSLQKEQFDETVTKIRNTVREHEFRMKGYEGQLNTTKLGIEELSNNVLTVVNKYDQNAESFKRLSASIIEFIRHTQDRFDTIEKGEWTQIGKETWILKAKKPKA